MNNNDLRRSLRLAAREVRAAVSPALRVQCSRAITQQVARSSLIRANSRIALFASMPDEPDVAPLARLAATRGASFYLPRIENARASRMRFAAVGQRWRINRYGIFEPEGNDHWPARYLNVIFLPLLAFDDAGTRLGMGGGYYDRALSFRSLRRYWRGPALIGVAYDAQRAAHVPAQPHDVQLDGVVTPSGLRWF